jgi:ribokinase
VVDQLPEAMTSVTVRQRIEVLGGKGANQAIGLLQLGRRPAVVGAVGDDDVAKWLLRSLGDDGVDVRGVVGRGAERTALIVSIVDSQGAWRYFEDVPVGGLVSRDDVEGSLEMFRAASVTSLQLQEPMDAVLSAAHAARSAGHTVVADGAAAPVADELLALLDLLRCDQREAELMTGIKIGTRTEALEAARTLAKRGPRVVVTAAGDDGNVVVWPGGEAVVPHRRVRIADTTGGGDAMLAGLISSLLDDPEDPIRALCLGTAAAGQVVQTIGGRPRLSADRVRREADALRDEVAVP